MDETGLPTLYEWAGGLDPLRRMIDRFYDRVEADEAMLRHHLGLAITPEQRHRFAATMSLAADEADLPEDPEFRAAVIGYLEWGTRLAMENARPGAEPPGHAPTPRWGWGVAPPYRG